MVVIVRMVVVWCIMRLVCVRLWSAVHCSLDCENDTSPRLVHTRQAPKSSHGCALPALATRPFSLHAPHVKLQAVVLELAARLNSEVAGLCQSRADSELRVYQRSTSVGSPLEWLVQLEGQSR